MNKLRRAILPSPSSIATPTRPSQLLERLSALDKENRTLRKVAAREMSAAEEDRAAALGPLYAERSRLMLSSLTTPTGPLKGLWLAAMERLPDVGPTVGP